MLSFDKQAADLIAFEALQRALSDAPGMLGDTLENTVLDLQRADRIDGGAAGYLLRNAERFSRSDLSGGFAPAWLV